MYLRYQGIILHLSIDLEEKMEVALVESESPLELKVESDAKSSFVKLLKFDFPKL